MASFPVKQEWDNAQYDQYGQYQSEQHQRQRGHQRLCYDPHHHLSLSPSSPTTSADAAALPLFVSEPTTNHNHNKFTSLSAFSDLSVRGFFSLAQWQELELQALIFKYMLVKAPVPAQLVESIKKTLPDNSPAFYLHHHLQPYRDFQQGMLPMYWRNAIDPEPGRCRRTDGKKWRCAKEVVVGQKYCERHMHRGRNRSRKPVESSTHPTASASLRTAFPVATSPSKRDASGVHFALSLPTPTPLNSRYPENKEEKQLFDNHCNNGYIESKTESVQPLRHFFNDWPISQQDSNGININANPESSRTGLSIAVPGDYQPPSDFSLKLATGNGEELPSHESHGMREHARWRNNHHGGPLAEALRQSASSSSPTSVLCGKLRHHQSGSDISGVSS